MYPVSSGYKAAIRSAGLKTTVRGTCGGTEFNDSNILAGSFSITGQCSGSDQVAIGQVYISELNITLRGLGTDRYSYRGQEVIPYFQLHMQGGTEEVPLGQYTISEAKNTAAGVVIRAYDHMALFDKSCPANSTSGLPYQLALLACNACGLGLATTQAEFSHFANGSEQLTLYTDQNDIETWRDFISWVAQSCACNVFANRNGQIEFRAYSRDAADELDTYHRFSGAEFSDFETYYTGLYLQDIEDQSMAYYDVEPDDGLTYNLGKNPFFQYGLETTIEAYCRAVLDAMQEIRYVPFKAETVDDPAYDLMDVVTMPGGIGDGSKLFCVTKYSWSYHGRLVLEGSGSDPALASAKSKVQKELSGILSKTSEDAVHFYRFTNAEDITVSDGSTEEILRIDFVTKKDAHVDFRAELKLESDTTETAGSDLYSLGDTAATVTYYLNGDEVEYHPLGTFTDGVFLEHLFYWWHASKNVIGTFVVALTAGGGDISIKAGELSGLLYGEGLVGETEDLAPVLSDDVPGLAFGIFGGFTDELDASVQVPLSGGASDTVGALAFDMLGGFTDTASALLGAVFTPYLAAAYIEAATVPVSGSYWAADEDGQYIQTAAIYGASGFTSATGSALSYQVSADGGETWGSWDGSSVTEGAEMTYQTMHSITSWPVAVKIKAIFDEGETLGGFFVEGGRLAL